MACVDDLFKLGLRIVCALYGNMEGNEDIALHAVAYFSHFLLQYSLL